LLQPITIGFCGNGYEKEMLLVYFTTMSIYIIPTLPKIKYKDKKMSFRTTRHTANLSGIIDEKGKFKVEKAPLVVFGNSARVEVDQGSQHMELRVEIDKTDSTGKTLGLLVICPLVKVQGLRAEIIAEVEPYTVFDDKILTHENNINKEIKVRNEL
jgi:hypothetical protein